MSDTLLPATRTPALPANPAALMGRLRGFAQQPAVARSIPLFGAAAALGLALLAWLSFASGPQRDLFTGLGDADKAAVADTLNTANIKYTLDRSSGALTVADSDYYRAKMLLAQAGLPKSAPDGDAMIASLPMGASRAVETERLRGAREQDLARTIEAIDAVDTAKVHLAVEQPSVFVRDATPAAASVMLRLRAGRTLSDGQVRAIVNLVGSSVPGLSPDAVSVVDQAGHLLSRNGGEGSNDRQMELQQRMETRYQEQIAKLLTPLVGADGFTTEVHTDLDFAEVQATRESYPKDNSVIRQEQGGWENNGAAGGAPAGGIPGAIANQPPTTAQVTATPPPAVTPGAQPGAQPGTSAAAATQGKTSETFNRTFEVGHEVSVTKNPVGMLKRLSVAVALKQGAKPRGVAELGQLEGLIKGAVGFDQQRGDQFALTSRAFMAEEPATAPKWYEASWLPMLGRNLAGPVIALLAFFGVVRPMMKKRAAALASAAAAGPARTNPEIGSQIAAALATEAAGNPAQKVTLDMIEAAPGYADRAALIRNFVRQDPDRAALVVRDLIRADMPGGVAQNG